MHRSHTTQQSVSFYGNHVCRTYPDAQSIHHVLVSPQPTEILGMTSTKSSPRSVACCGKCFAAEKIEDMPVLESSGNQWIEFCNGSTCAKAKKSWEGLDDGEGEAGMWGNGASSSGCQAGKTSTVWTMPCSRHKASHAEFKILNMRGRSIVQVGLTRLPQARRSTFWGDVEEGQAWYLFLDKYGFTDLRDGAKTVHGLEKEALDEAERDCVTYSDSTSETVIQGSTLRTKFNPASGTVSFFRNGVLVGAQRVPAEAMAGLRAGGGEVVFAAQMLGRGDALELVQASGLAGSQAAEEAEEADEEGEEGEEGEHARAEAAAEEAACRCSRRCCGGQGGGNAHAALVECADGHRCVLSAYCVDGYERGWMCSRCGVLEQGRRFFCPQCQFDLCKACQPAHVSEQAGVAAARRAAAAAALADAAASEAGPAPDFPFHLLTPKKALFHIEGHGAYCPACNYASNSAFASPHMDNAPAPHKFTGPQVQYYYSGLSETGFV